MKVLICHERFIFRFGADRVLILLAKGLSELGHKVTLMGNRFEKDSAKSFANGIVEVPLSQSGSLDANEFTYDWLESNWNRVFEHSQPDVIVVGGWPFISAISFFRRVCANVIFIDFGVVPNEGYSEEMVATLERLRCLRRKHLRDASTIAPISRFIANSQSCLEAGDSVPVRPILLGADHLENPIWRPARFKSSLAEHEPLRVTLAARSQGKKILLALGRWEPGCYKNSQAALQIVRDIKLAGYNCLLLLLDQPSAIHIPEDLLDSVLPIGFPSDDELVMLMKLSDVGLSVSLWEGFNLPLAEMQWFGRPVLAFNLGAHPEVIADEWYLCSDTSEMVAKSLELLENRRPDPSTLIERLSNFKNYFRWSRFIWEYSDMFDALQDQNQYTSVFLASGLACHDRTDWTQVLYPGCLCQNWQMNDSERLALTGLLARCQPHVSIEVGTYRGGSLSLIAQYSKMVFSIDIDQSVSKALSFPNVTFLSGPSHLILRHLLAQIDNEGISPEFILIDGDYSAQGVMRDAACIIEYVPRKPLFVAIHDSFNPDCRYGILHAGWENSPYCHHLELDFVPGKIAGGQLWGGLALVYLSPEPRTGSLELKRSAEEMFQIVASHQARAATNGLG